jgi:hypothetical protein
VCSETSAYKIQTPGKCPEESIQHSEQGDSLKSRILSLSLWELTLAAIQIEFEDDYCSELIVD